MSSQILYQRHPPLDAQPAPLPIEPGSMTSQAVTCPNEVADISSRTLLFDEDIQYFLPDFDVARMAYSSPLFIVQFSRLYEPFVTS